MSKIALTIKQEDWLFILFIGVVFSTILAMLGYAMFEAPLLHGGLFGALLGFCITLFSLVFITYLNNRVLPNLQPLYWTPLAILFSFLAGFIGTLLAIVAANLLSIELLDFFAQSIFGVSAGIGVLTYIVGALMYRFVKMRNEKELVDSHYLKSRLASLERQLNPHFMFNALNSIAELIHQDPNRAEEAVLRVSKFLRNSMEERALVRLQDELNSVRDYVELENIRFSGKIRLHMPDEVPSWSVPKFSVQLLVENAIKHGYVKEMGKLDISIHVNKIEGVISVINNGKALTNAEFGVGLSNLSQRLSLLCKGSLKVAQWDHPKFIIELGECRENIDR